jgi:topoisomerase-4 subunit A
MNASQYIEEEAKQYALYTIKSRAIPYFADGVKPGARRVLWCARDGHKYKSATLAGMAIPLHPHAPPEDAVNSCTGPYVNNIPLFEKTGVFGTLIKPTAYGASRYTSVKLNSFAKDVFFKDIEIIPMVPNYDSTEMEPKHFLPLIPMVLLNPASGIAVGYATDILPRQLRDIVESQLEHLAGKEVKERAPCFTPTNNPALRKDIDRKGVERWVFRGEYKVLNASEVRLTKLPYGITHADFVQNLQNLMEAPPTIGKASKPNPDFNLIMDYDDHSKNMINIVVKFRRGVLAEISKGRLEDLLGIERHVTENLNVITFTGNAIAKSKYVNIIKNFTEWRLEWFIDRYVRLLSLITVDIQKYDDILLAIKKNVPGVSKKTANRGELKEYIESIGVVHVDYIADLPLYRFTEEEARKVEEKRLKALEIKADYENILEDDDRRKSIYVNELKDVLKKYGEPKPIKETK